MPLNFDPDSLSERELALVRALDAANDPQADRKQVIGSLDPADRTAFAYLATLQAEAQAAAKQTPVADGWARLQTGIGTESAAPMQAPSRAADRPVDRPVDRPAVAGRRLRGRIPVWMQATAAALALVLVAAIWLGRTVTETITVAANAAPTEQTLPDGSTVWLRPNSTLTYPTRFATDRQVTLSGTAFFNVSHDAAHPFTVHTTTARTTVLGTTFTVEAGAERTAVALFTGRVQVAGTQGSVTLAPGERTTVGAASDPSAPLRGVAVTWLPDRWQFAATPLSEATETVAVALGVRVEITDAALRAVPVSGTILRTDAATALGDLATVAGARLTQVGPTMFRLTAP